RKLQQKRTKSRVWLEAECLKIARRTLGGSEIQLVTIRRLHPKGAGPNWKVADIIPQPTAPVSEVVRAALAHLPDAYHLEEEGVPGSSTGTILLSRVQRRARLAHEASASESVITAALGCLWAEGSRPQGSRDVVLEQLGV